MKSRENKEKRSPKEERDEELICEECRKWLVDMMKEQGKLIDAEIEAEIRRGEDPWPKNPKTIEPSTVMRELKEMRGEAAKKIKKKSYKEVVEEIKRREKAEKNNSNNPFGVNYWLLALIGISGIILGGCLVLFWLRMRRKSS